MASTSSTSNSWIKAFCKAVSQESEDSFTVVKRLCDKRLQHSPDKALGYFAVSVRECCYCFGIPNRTLYHCKTFKAKNIHHVYIWERYFDPISTIQTAKIPSLIKMMSTGRCKCNERMGGFILEQFTTVRQISPLAIACFYGKVEIVRYLLDVDPSAINFSTCTTPLMMTLLGADSSTGVEIARILIKNGAGVNVVDRLSKLHALELAVLKNNSEMIRLLLENGVDVNSLSVSPLPLTDDLGCIEMLVASGAKMINRISFICPLRWAISQKKKDIYTLFLKSPAFEEDPSNLHSIDNLAPLALRPLLRDDRLIPMLDLLVKRGFPADSYVSPKLEIGGTSILYEPLHNHLNALWNMEKRLIGPASFWAAAWCNQKYMAALIERGADVNFRNFYGMTTLMAFAWMEPRNDDQHQRREFFSFLLQHGIDLDARDILGRSAVFYAITSFFPDPLFTLNLLLERNVDFDVRQKTIFGFREDRSFFYLACVSGRLQKARLLLQYGYDIRKEMWLMKSGLRPLKLQQDVGALSEFLSIFQTPGSLKCLCRSKIRSLLGTGIVASSKYLGLPELLQSYILFQ